MQTVPADHRSSTAGVCLIGAGPQALTVAVHLRTAGYEESIVSVDPSGRWLANWHDQFARLEIANLRSPGVHHTGVDAGELDRFVRRRGLPTSDLPYSPPVTEAFAAHCNHLVEVHGLEPPFAGKVRGLRRSGDRWVVETGADRILARHVVVAANPHRRALPEWLWSVLPTAPGAVTHADDLDLRDVGALTGRRVTVVGGGLTAAHLVVGAVRRGARVDLVTRRPLETRAFDTDPCWLGPRCLDGFVATPHPADRLRLARSARGGGSIPAWMRRALARMERSGHLTIHEGREIVGATIESDGISLAVRAAATVDAHHVWLATGTVPELSALRALRPLLVDIPLVDGYPVPDADLCIGPAALHFVGRLATIELGPAAGNLWGARQAGRRIARALTGVELAGDGVVTVGGARGHAFRRARQVGATGRRPGH